LIYLAKEKSHLIVPLVRVALEEVRARQEPALVEPLVLCGKKEAQVAGRQVLPQTSVPREEEPQVWELLEQVGKILGGVQNVAVQNSSVQNSSVQNVWVPNNCAQNVWVPNNCAQNVWVPNNCAQNVWVLNSSVPSSCAQNVWVPSIGAQLLLQVPDDGKSVPVQVQHTLHDCAVSKNDTL
jgi:hypothetical protein